MLETIKRDLQKKGESYRVPLNGEYHKDMVSGLFHQIKTVAMFNPTMIEGGN
jgi:hypothetical protein